MLMDGLIVRLGPILKLCHLSRETYGVVANTASICLRFRWLKSNIELWPKSFDLLINRIGAKYKHFQTENKPESRYSGHTLREIAARIPNVLFLYWTSPCFYIGNCYTKFKVKWNLLFFKKIFIIRLPLLVRKSIKFSFLWELKSIIIFIRGGGEGDDWDLRPWKWILNLLN